MFPRQPPGPGPSAGWARCRAGAGLLAADWAGLGVRAGEHRCRCVGCQSSLGHQSRAITWCQPPETETSEVSSHTETLVSYQDMTASSEWHDGHTCITCPAPGWCAHVYVSDHASRALRRGHVSSWRQWVSPVLSSLCHARLSEISSQNTQPLL